MNRAFAAVLLAVALAWSCGSAAAPGGPDVYDLVALKSPYVPGSVVTSPTTCNRVLHSSITRGSLTLDGDANAEVSLLGYYETPSSFNAPGIPCPSLLTFNLNATKRGNYQRFANTVSIFIDGREFASGPMVADSIALIVTGYTVLTNDPNAPLSLLSRSTWRRR